MDLLGVDGDGVGQMKGIKGVGEREGECWFGLL